MQDILRIGELEFFGQEFAGMVLGADCTLAEADFDGVLGLGHESVAVKGRARPLYNMCDQGLLDDLAFAL
jgi:saccharopepsin